MDKELSSSVIRIPTLQTQKIKSGWGVRRIILLLIILQSIGIRALPIQGVLSGALICLVLAFRINISIGKILSFMVLCGIYVMLAARGMSSYKEVVYLTLIILLAFLFSMYVKSTWIEVEKDLLVVTWWLSLHGLVSYLIYLLIPDNFSTVNFSGGLFQIFGVFVIKGPDPTRATGFCWEPGLLQYIANIGLFLGIRHSWSLWRLAVFFFTIVFTFSTAGIFVLFVNLLYFLVAFQNLRKNRRLRLFTVVATFSIFLILFMGGFYDNLNEKLSGENTSGLIRYRDFMIGLELIKQKPFLGHGVFALEYLKSIPKVSDIDIAVLGKEFIRSTDELAGGFTNGFVHVFSINGLIIGCFIFYLFYKNSVIRSTFRERITFFLISVISFMSEPITLTSFFYFFVISGMFTLRYKSFISARNVKQKCFGPA